LLTRRFGHPGFQRPPPFHPWPFARSVLVLRFGGDPVVVVKLAPVPRPKPWAFGYPHRHPVPFGTAVPEALHGAALGDGTVWQRVGPGHYRLLRQSPGTMP
jgi:hypothetical protein